MNCHEINLILDAGTFSKLPATDRLAAEEHARSCRHCAPLWAAHTRLAQLRIPPMPPDLVPRTRMLVAVQRAERPRLRRLTLIGGLVALSAAAAAWVWSWNGFAPEASTIAPAPAASTPGAPLPSTGMVGSPDTGPGQLPGAKAQDANSADARLPRVLPPASNPPDPDKIRQVMERALERHPEMVQGPPLDDNATFIVVMTMRTGGVVLDSSAELSSPDTIAEIMNRLPRRLPVDSGERIFHIAENGPMTDGRALRARTILQAVLIPDDFDVSRTDVRVREILGHKYDDLMRPPTSDEAYMVTVFLSDDGQILRDKVERIRNESTVMGTGGAGGREAIIALKLGIDTAQIGQIGSTMIERGTPRSAVGSDGLRRVEGVQQLGVLYAWERRSQEPVPATASRNTILPDAADFDLEAALVVAERIFPDAFSHAPPSRHDLQIRPTVVFTADGEVLRAGRVQLRSGVTVDSLLEEQLVPGVATSLHRSVQLTNGSGAMALVEFAWAD